MHPAKRQYPRATIRYLLSVLWFLYLMKWMLWQLASELGQTIREVFYQDMVRRCIQMLIARCRTPQSQMAVRILGIIRQDRGEQFFLEKQRLLFVMGPTAARNKVTLALTRSRKVIEPVSQPNMKPKLPM